MKKLLIVGAIFATLSGCSSDDPAAGLSGTITHALLDGTWSKCENDGPSTSFSVMLVFNNGAGTYDETTFPNLDCVSGGAAQPQETFTYTLGGDVTVDGTVAGITSATEFNFTTGGSTTLDVLTIENLTTLYTGDGTSTTRATSLDAASFAFVSK